MTDPNVINAGRSDKDITASEHAHAGERPRAAELVTMGCRLNGAESEAMRRLADEAGLEQTIIVNSCAVTNEAVRQTRQHIRRARRDRPDAAIVVTGCAAQIDPNSFAAMSEVDAVVGNDEKLSLASWRRLAQTPGRHDDDAGDAKPMLVNDIMSVRETAPHMVDGYGDRARAFLQIQNGCDHRCTFCIIPYGRGNSRSAPIAEVVAQARKLVENGHRELVLTGVDITSYGADLEGAPQLGALVSAVLDQTPDLFRLRLSSIDGAEIDEALFERIADDKRIAPYLHLSLQAGDDLILKRMKRRHNRAQAIAFCQDLRARRPEIAFGADLIAGFPTETDEMFEQSLKLVDEAGLNYLHVFPFSPREGAPAARMPQLDRGLIKRRAAILRDKGDAATRAFLDQQIGRIETAVIESGGRARLGNFAEVRLEETSIAPHLSAGALARVKIHARADKTLIGALVASAPHEGATETPPFPDQARPTFA